MKRCFTLVACILVVGCGGKKDSGDDKGAGGTGSASDDQEHVADLARAPAKALAGHAAGIDYMIDLPDDASLPRFGTDTASYDFKGTAIKLEIRARPTPILPDELNTQKELSMEGRTKGTELLVRADQSSADSYVVVKKKKDETWFLYERCRNVPYGSVCCAMTRTITKPAGDWPAVEVWTDATCMSLTVQGEAHAAPKTPLKRSPNAGSAGSPSPGSAGSQSPVGAPTK